MESLPCQVFKMIFDSPTPGQCGSTKDSKPCVDCDRVICLGHSDKAGTCSRCAIRRMQKRMK